jgi:WXXGXW repeat (2 copies)
MNTVSRRHLLGSLTVLTGIAATAGPALAQLQAEIYIPTAPPPPRVEVIPTLPPERIEVERWQPGHWRWNGHEHVWVEGRYVARPRPRAEWIPGRWEQRPRGWVYVDGHWN